MMDMGNMKEEMKSRLEYKSEQLLDFNRKETQIKEGIEAMK